MSYIYDTWVPDRYGWRYRFSVYTLDSAVYGYGSVYAWTDSQTVPLYIGSAINLSERLNGHERINEAINHGACALWVHTPNIYDPIPYNEVEKRLIQTYCPRMNHQHNWLKALMEVYPMPTGQGIRRVF